MTTANRSFMYVTGSLVVHTTQSHSHSPFSVLSSIYLTLPQCILLCTTFCPLLSSDPLVRSMPSCVGLYIYIYQHSSVMGAHGRQCQDTTWKCNRLNEVLQYKLHVVGYYRILGIECVCQKNARLRVFTASAKFLHALI